MTPWQSPEFDAHEEVCLFSDPTSGQKAVIAIHSTARGCAVGGTRLSPYDSDTDALNDALRLSRAMSLKSALAGLPFGGGKAVLVARTGQRKRDVLERYAEWLNTLDGRFCTGEDVGISIEDCDWLRTRSSFVAGTSAGAGDPSWHTARGVFYGIQAVVETAFHRRDVDGLKIAIQGLGNVGWHLCRLLHSDGARLLVTDVVEERASRAAEEFDAVVVPPDRIAAADADVFAPCAFGRVLTESCVERMRVRAIAGCANNQLASPVAGERLFRRGILYAPDFVLNAGGLIAAAEELASVSGAALPSDVSIDVRLRGIYKRLLAVFQASREQARPPEQVAEQQATEILRNSQTKR